jgi:hypothetical protein
MPRPGRARTPIAAGTATPSRRACATTATATGWLECASTAAAAASTSARVNPGAGATPATPSSPAVKVPVLSNASARTAASRSSAAPPFTSTPRLAAADTAATIETGVEITSAHGHETTSRTSARYTHSRAGAPSSGGTMARASAATITDGV